MARFDSNGNEKYSTEITELPEGHKFSVFNSNSLIVINDSVLILCGWFVRADYYDGFFNLANGLLDQDIFTTFLSVFNFKNGREISRIDSVNGSALYSVSEWDNGYIIERNDDYRDNVSVKEKSILLDYSGNLLWNGDKSDLQAHIPKPDIPGPVDPIIPDSIIGNLQLGIMFVVDQSGAQRYLTVRFNTNIDKPVTITDLKVYDADGNIMVS
ncbi:MAG: hypothetical protein LBR49_05145 [Tannerella sp.]|jgi:hypothetical protein|nr:hypothetical protein [Tannerella sp.]